MGTKVITPPVGEPVAAADCWRHLRLDGAYDSPPVEPQEAGMIAAYLSAAREWAEAFTSNSLAPQTLELALDRFPLTDSDIQLLRGPVSSVVSVTYVDTDGIVQTVDPVNYELDTYSDTAWLTPIVDYAWPSTLGVVNAVKVRYVAGFTLPGDSPQTYPLPKSVRAALLSMLGDLYENRENTVVDGRVTVQQVTFGVKALLMQHRVGMGV